MKRKSKGRSSCLAVALALTGVMLCLSLPGLSAWVGEKLTDGQQWSMESEADYRFAGTFENRVSALNAYLNASPHIHCEEECAQASSGEIWTRLAGAGLVPAWEGEVVAQARRFALVPAQCEARFEYVETTMRGGPMRLTVTADALTGAVIRAELTGARQALPEWKNGESYPGLLGRYVSFLGYATNIDLNGSYAEDGAMAVERGLIRETYLEVSLTLARPAGVMIYALSLAGS